MSKNNKQSVISLGDCLSYDLSIGSEDEGRWQPRLAVVYTPQFSLIGLVAKRDRYDNHPVDVYGALRFLDTEIKIKPQGEAFSVNFTPPVILPHDGVVDMSIKVISPVAMIFVNEQKDPFKGQIIHQYRNFFAPTRIHTPGANGPINPDILRKIQETKQ